MSARQTASPGRGPGTGSHRCPGPGCQARIQPSRLACKQHWYALPRPLRDAIWATWRGGAGAGTPEHRAAVDEAAAYLSSREVTR